MSHAVSSPKQIGFITHQLTLSPRPPKLLSKLPERYPKSAPDKTHIVANHLGLRELINRLFKVLRRLKNQVRTIQLSQTFPKIKASAEPIPARQADTSAYEERDLSHLLVRPRCLSLNKKALKTVTEKPKTRNINALQIRNTHARPNAHQACPHKTSCIERVCTSHNKISKANSMATERGAACFFTVFPS